MSCDLDMLMFGSEFGLAIFHQTQKLALNRNAYGTQSFESCLKPLLMSMSFFHPVLSYHSCTSTGILCNENDLTF